METKICIKCNEELPVEDFLFDNKEKKRRRNGCKQCQYAYTKSYKKQNREKIKKSSSAYYFLNKKQTQLRQKKYREINREYIKKRNKAYREVNKEKILASRLLNKEQIALNNKKWRDAPARYDTYAEQISYADKVKKSWDGNLICFCTYCGIEFVPTTQQVQHRIRALNGGSGELRLYCSEECKKACPTYHQHLTPKSTKKATSREVSAWFRKLALADRNHTCEKCGSKEKGLHVHHIDGVTEQPLLSEDLANVLVLCKSCHKKVHKKTGCSYYDYRCKVA